MNNKNGLIKWISTYSKCIIFTKEQIDLISVHNMAHIENNYSLTKEWNTPCVYQAMHKKKFAKFSVLCCFKTSPMLGLLNEHININLYLVSNPGNRNLLIFFMIILPSILAIYHGPSMHFLINIFLSNICLPLTCSIISLLPPNPPMKYITENDHKKLGQLFSYPRSLLCWYSIWTIHFGWPM